ncbi:MAG: hypothetical protein U0324_01965 [Polyangiales bacterium]
MRPSFLALFAALAACSSPDSSWLGAALGDASPDVPVIPGAPSPDVPAAPDSEATPDVPSTPDATTPPDASPGLDVAPPLDAPQPPDAPPPPDVVTAPDAPRPDAARSDATVPDAAAPDVSVPDAALPDIALPDISLPDIGLPDIGLPDVPPPVRCGDRVCIPLLETCSSCPTDCGACDPCASNTACGTCTPVSGCGWCRASNRCVSGTATGSNDRACSGTNWAWTTMDCAPADPCARFTTCRTCTEQSMCGWCGAAGRCATGTDRGPNVGTCSRWSWTSATCG